MKCQVVEQDGEVADLHAAFDDHFHAVALRAVPTVKSRQLDFVEAVGKQRRVEEGQASTRCCAARATGKLHPVALTHETLFQPPLA